LKIKIYITEHIRKLFQNLKHRPVLKI